MTSHSAGGEVVLGEDDKLLPGGKVKKAEAAEIIFTTTSRGKKHVTSVEGLERFGGL